MPRGPVMNSPVVHVRLGGPVAVIRLADDDGRNAFTPTLSAEFRDAFGQAVAEPASRVILLAGLPEIFCSGGTRADLLGGLGSAPATEQDSIIRAPLRCPLPVVAAMQGHAIGGGLLLGLYCDIPVLSERSVYAANFLDYGFLPCMGATWVLPHRLGPTLGTEVLLGAARHRGAQFRDRGAPLRVLAHDQVEPAAEQFASRIARAPRLALEHAKAVLSAKWRRASSQAFDLELPGHLETLRLPEVRQRMADACRQGADDPIVELML
jgi:polyketide biosynthesis enoyl-CoA hydratase PksI